MKRDELRRDLGDDYDTARALNRRVFINEQQNFHFHRAIQLEKTGALVISSYDYLIIAVVLIDMGRNLQAVEYYNKSYRLSIDALDKALTRRVYGRALIIAGNREKGKTEMLQSIRDIEALLCSQEYDNNRLKYDIVDTYIRLISVLNVGTGDEDIGHFLNIAENFAGNIVDLGRKKMAYSMIEEMRSIKLSRRDIRIK